MSRLTSTPRRAGTHGGNRLQSANENARGAGGLGWRIGQWIGFAVLTLSVGGGSALAQNAKPPEMSLAAAAARRFPQPVRVGDLINRTVLQPVESQPVLGHVRQIVRCPDATVQAVVEYGGLLGIGTRPIAVPVDAMVLLGSKMEIMDYTPKQLADLPTYDGHCTTPVASDDMIRVGLARPSH